MSDNFIILAIDEISRTDFEIWCQQILYQDKNFEFEPTGGVKDGGQDGFLRPRKGTPDHYVQISKEEKTANKIRKTVKRLKQTRSLSKLTYVTSESENERDLLEAKLKKEFQVEFEILDRRWLLIQAKLHDNIRDNLFKYSKDLIENLEKASNSEPNYDASKRLNIVSYLEAHVKSLDNDESFQALCLDTLIYNSLIDTDPAKDVFCTRDEIYEEISRDHPNVLAKADTTLEQRLGYLSSKSNNPRIRSHPGDRYALPYEVRNSFDEENLRIAAIEDEFVGSINKRLNMEGISQADDLRPYIVPCVHHAIKETYKEQAMNFIASFENMEFDSAIDVYSIIDNYTKDQSVPVEIEELVRDKSAKIFRHICYSSTEKEREYLELLLKFSTLKFVMDGNGVVTRYFTELAKNLRLYVGTDILVRCLSEVLVHEGSRGMTKSLQLLSKSGVSLRLTRQTLSEVFSHIRHSTRIFTNDYSHWFRHAELTDVINCDRILIRSFFYARLEPDRHVRQPRDWSDYLRSFGSAIWFSKVDDETSEEYLDDFGSYLVDRFGLEFVEIDEVLSTIDEDLASKVASEILDRRENTTEGSKILAKNDAQMALFINSERARLKERVASDLYGLNTWWLTEETTVLRVLKNFGQRSDVVMHPQFLMNHYVLDPAFIKSGLAGSAQITPTLFGLRITNRIPHTEMQTFIRRIGDLAGLDEAAQRARIRKASNQIKRHPQQW
ncbi:restriction endonuclease [Alteriqipengyuania lutimaris]|uniref:restriction endonuclease n=1 Tax=Alteriqipengyuania lutimaris TaxID=1538146 RepID=UPI001CFCF755|nr:restriction endonuclease [Alteriqipengyuania lutimaris]